MCSALESRMAHEWREREQCEGEKRSHGPGPACGSPAARCGGADPVAQAPTPTSVATEGRSEAAVVDRPDMDYVDALCLIGTLSTAEGQEAAGRWGVAFET